MAAEVDCGQLKEALGLIKQLKGVFDKAVEAAMESGDATEPRRLKKELDTHIDALRSKIGITLDDLANYLEGVPRENIYGPGEIMHTYGFIPLRVPRIPFSKEEIRKALMEDKQLVLYPGRLADNKSPTLKNLVELFRDQHGKAPFALRQYEQESFYATETMRSGWALVTKSAQMEATVRTTGTMNQNYLTQIARMVKYLEETGVRDPEIQEAIREFHEKKEELGRNLVGSKWVPNSAAIADLKINQLLRESFVEASWRLLMEKKSHGNASDRASVWTKTRMSNGTFVKVKMLASSLGLGGNEQQPGAADGETAAYLLLEKP